MARSRCRTSGRGWIWCILKWGKLVRMAQGTQEEEKGTWKRFVHLFRFTLTSQECPELLGQRGCGREYIGGRLTRGWGRYGDLPFALLVDILCLGRYFGFLRMRSTTNTTDQYAADDLRAKYAEAQRGHDLEAIDQGRPATHLSTSCISGASVSI